MYLSDLVDVQNAQFDLDNSGQVSTVQRVEATSHFFDGSAFARGRPDILTTPFDPHASEKARTRGILVFVYQHALVLFEGGQTYMLLNPANPSMDVALVKPTVTSVEEVCVMRRVTEQF